MEKIDVFVKRVPLNNTMQYSMQLNDTIHDLKARIFNQTDLPVSDIILYMNRKVFRDTQTLAEVFGTSSNSVNILMKRKVNLNAKSNDVVSYQSLTSIKPMTSIFARSVETVNQLNLANKLERVDPKLLNLLLDMGFPEKDCRCALIVSCHNIDRAADYLIKGDIPRSGRSKLPSIRRTRSGPAQQSHTPTKVDSTQAMKLTKEEFLQFMELLKNGYDEFIAAQYYMVCDKDIKLTKELLDSQK
ncbi:hypothetical protein TRFO_04074 [Tritrichomonas foetus]|uniref:UBA/TS-N domain containing protein n=1 Tax=Tritrichomonas foetus TaxID=1144522 RepID=A0A1J4KJ52_9EUKA|nr:hypothetical protein TRFO_04074 [Tritrichomonas foetus]|eukprot:OHT11114.1 hypothetical protein TRFO_04074 [Tritrichomonas foetus]